MTIEDAHDLIPEEMLGSIPPLYATAKDADPIVHIRLFTPDSNWTWLIPEFHPQARLAFGRTDGHESELGYISIQELEQVTGPLGLKIERDLYWTPRPLSLSDKSPAPEQAPEPEPMHRPCADPFWDSPEGNDLINNWIAGKATEEETSRLEKAQSEDPALLHKVAVMELLTRGLEAMEEACQTPDDTPKPPGPPKP